MKTELIDLQHKLHEFADKFIPSKTTSTRHNLPWMDMPLKRKRKKRLFIRVKKTDKKEHWMQYKSYKKEILKALRQARWQFINKKLTDSLEEKINHFGNILKAKSKITSECLH